MRRGAVALLAAALAVAGALLGGAVHWWGVQPSDDELVTTARSVHLPGFTGADEPRVTGAWAPSFDRGVVHWDASATTPLAEAAVGVGAALEEQGWTLARQAVGERSGDVVAARGGLVLTLHLRAASASETEASVELRRGPTTLGLSALAVGGAVVGAVMGVGLGALLRNRRHGGWHPGGTVDRGR